MSNQQSTSKNLKAKIQKGVEQMIRGDLVNSETAIKRMKAVEQQLSDRLSKPGGVLSISLFQQHIERHYG